MAVICPCCRKQYDITLFQFGKALKCDCGHIIDLTRYYPPTQRFKLTRKIDARRYRLTKPKPFIKADRKVKRGRRYDSRLDRRGGR
jgi:hypothetical protein